MSPVEENVAKSNRQRGAQGTGALTTHSLTASETLLHPKAQRTSQKRREKEFKSGRMGGECHEVLLSGMTWSLQP